MAFTEMSTYFRFQKYILGTSLLIVFLMRITKDGFLIMLSEIVGSLIGAGMVYVFDKNSEAKPYVYLGTSVVTGAISSYFIKKSFDKKK